MPEKKKRFCLSIIAQRSSRSIDACQLVTSNGNFGIYIYIYIAVLNDSTYKRDDWVILQVLGEAYGYMCVLNRVSVIAGLIRLTEGS